MINPELKKRILSLIWRVGGIAAVAALNELSKAIGDFGLPIYVVAMIGLTVNEITKWLNKTLMLGKRVMGAIKGERV